jgi:hypothetical protein
MKEQMETYITADYFSGKEADAYTAYMQQRFGLRSSAPAFIMQ